MALLFWQRSASADMATYVIDSGSSQLTFSGSLLLPGPATWPLVIRNVGDNLTANFSGSFQADPALSTLAAGGTLTQINGLQGTIVDGANNVQGTMNIANSVANRMTMTLSSASQVSFLNGLLQYSVPSLGITGSFPLAGTVISAGTPTFGTLSGQPSAAFPVSFSGVLPTTMTGVFLSLSISGNIRGAVAAVPEPSSLFAAGLAVAVVGRHLKRRFGASCLKKK